MVAKVISGKNIRGVLNYNENKVKAGVAECIMASKFGCKPKELTFSDKLNRFDKLLSRNRNVKTNAIHISLNFDASEKISDDKLSQIINAYMTRIGFGNQPFLAYQHHDAAHPHVHIVTTNVQADGKRIDIHNIGRNQSEKARKEIEKHFGLVRAESRKQETDKIMPVNIARAIYGKSETRRSISNIVRYVAKNYRYTSLPEFTAALKQFNVIADRGREKTRMFEKKGLLYSLLDKDGKKVGIPVKASSIYGKPMLPFLEKQFKLNEVLRMPNKDRLRKCIDKTFENKKTLTKEAFTELLNKQNIYMLFRRNDENLIYGVTFVDNTTKTVFNGSDLGKSYSAKAIQERLTKLTSPDKIQFTESFKKPDTDYRDTKTGLEQVVEDLITSKQYDYAPSDRAFRRKKKKKKGRSI